MDFLIWKMVFEIRFQGWHHLSVNQAEIEVAIKGHQQAGATKYLVDWW